MNIFARELNRLLVQEGKDLGSLYALHSPNYQLLPNKVTRLRQSLKKDITATLNVEEIEFVADRLGWKPDGDEIRRLRAALVAESVRRLLGGRTDKDNAQKVGELTLALMLRKEPDPLRDEVMDGVRGGFPWEESESSAARGMPDEEENQQDNDAPPVEQALEPAVSAYEQGALWLEVAKETTDRGARLGHLAQARTLLAHAKDLATNAPSIAPDSAIRQEWLTIIDSALAEANTLR